MSDHDETPKAREPTSESSPQATSNSNEPKRRSKARKPRSKAQRSRAKGPPLDLETKAPKPRKPKKGSLSVDRKADARRRIFALEWVVSHNGRKSAIRAGYSEKSAHDAANRLLKDPKVRAYIEQATKEHEERLGLTIERITLELYRILTADIGQVIQEDGTFLPVSQWPPDVRKAVSGIETREDRDGGTIRKVKFWSKDNSAEKLLKVLGGFAPERVAVTHTFSDLHDEIEEEYERPKAPQPSDSGHIEEPLQ